MTTATPEAAPPMPPRKPTCGECALAEPPPPIVRRCMGASRLFCPVHQVYVCADECRCSHYVPLTAQRNADRG